MPPDRRTFGWRAHPAGVPVPDAGRPELPRPRRADQPPRHRLDRGARGRPGALRRHGRRRVPRPLFPRSHRRPDRARRPRRRDGLRRRLVRQRRDRAVRAIIARVWRGAVKPPDADAYAEYIDGRMRSTPRRPATAAPGCCRASGDRTEFITSLWDPTTPLRAFAGDDYEVARFYPEDDRYLVERDVALPPLGRGPKHLRRACPAMPDATNGAGRALVSGYFVVPVYNEAATVGQVVDELLALVPPAGGPARRRRLHGRGRRARAARWAPRQVQFLRQPQNRGKGAAVRRGITESTGHRADPGRRPRVRPRGLSRAARPDPAGKADVVFGTRSAAARTAA